MRKQPLFATIIFVATLVVASLTACGNNGNFPSAPKPTQQAAAPTTGTAPESSTAQPAPAANLPDSLLQKLQSCTLVSPTQVNAVLAGYGVLPAGVRGSVTFEPGPPSNPPYSIKRNICRYSVNIDGAQVETLVLDWDNTPADLEQVFTCYPAGSAALPTPPQADCAWASTYIASARYPGLAIDVGQADGTLLELRDIRPASIQLLSQLTPVISACYASDSC